MTQMSKLYFFNRGNKNDKYKSAESAVRSRFDLFAPKFSHPNCQSNMNMVSGHNSSNNEISR